MRIIKNALVVVTLTALLLATPANADSQDSNSDTAFDSAQEALGLSAVDATTLDPGVTATTEGNEAVVSFGEFDVKVTAPSDKEAETTVLSDGVRVMSLLRAGETSVTFTIELPNGASLTPSGNGFNVVIEADGTQLSLGQIAEPWAVDANGTKLPTSYSLNDDKLTQYVDTDGAVYPIVADPAVTIGVGADGPGIYWNMYGYQAKAISAASIAAVNLALAGGCAAASKVPKIGGLLSGICGFVGAPTLTAVFADIQKVLNNTKVDSNSCYQLRIPLGSGLHKTDKANCA